MSAVSSYSQQPFAGSNALAFPKGDRATIIAHLKSILDPNVSPTNLEGTVEDFLKMTQERNANQWLWSDLKEVLDSPSISFMRTIAFLRILGQKYVEQRDFGAVDVLKPMLQTHQAHWCAFLDGLREGSNKGRWPADRYLLEVVKHLLTLQELPPDLNALHILQNELQLAVDALPSPDYPGAFDHKAAAIQQKELLTPQKRLRWDQVMKLYFSNLGIKTDNGSDGWRFQDCILDILTSLSQSGKLSQRLGSLLPDKMCGKHAFSPLIQKEISVRNAYFHILHLPASPLSRKHNLHELLKSNFTAIRDNLSEQDKALICSELEKILLESIYKWANFLNTVDDRKEGWIEHKLNGYQHYAPAIIVEQHQRPHRWPDASLDKCERRVQSLNQFSLKLDSQKLKPFNNDPALLEQNGTRIILEHRRDVINKTFAGLLETATSCKLEEPVNNFEYWVSSVIAP